MCTDERQVLDVGSKFNVTVRHLPENDRSRLALARLALARLVLERLRNIASGV